MMMMTRRRSAGVESQLAVSHLKGGVLLCDWLQGYDLGIGFSGISWSIKEMAGSNQKIDREPAFPRIPTEPSTLNKSHSGLSLSSLFRGMWWERVM